MQHLVQTPCFQNPIRPFQKRLGIGFGDSVSDRFAWWTEFAFDQAQENFGFATLLALGNVLQSMWWLGSIGGWFAAGGF